MRDTHMPKIAKAYIALILAIGLATTLFAAISWTSADLTSFAVFFAITVFASTLKVRVPGMTSTMSPNFAFLVIGMVRFSWSKVAVAALAAGLVQSIWRAKQPRVVQVSFNAATLVLSASASFALSHAIVTQMRISPAVPVVVLGGCFYTALNTALVSLVVSLVEGQEFSEVCQRCYEAVFPSFFAGITVAGLLSGSLLGTKAWQASATLLPATILGYVYLRGHNGRTLRPELAVEDLEEELVGASSGHRR
jgi:hypothetical protein